MGIWYLATSAYVTLILHFPLPPTSTFQSLTLYIAGFVRNVSHTSNSNGWDHIFNLSYFYGFIITMLGYWVLHLLFPAERQDGSSPFTLEHSDRASSVDNATKASGDDVEKVSVQAEKQ